MERIKQALEKARLERQQASGVSPVSQGSPAKQAFESVTYSQTRTVSLPKDLQERRIITGYEQNAYTDSFKILRTQVLQRLSEKNWNSLAITSPGVNEGKTLIAINLAISLSLELNYTVLLVDADLRQPSIHKYFGIDAEYGLADYLTADKPLPELLVHPAEIPRFIMLPGGKALSNSSEMLNSPKMIRLVEELKTRYPSRIILFDLPPLLSAADALTFSPYVDAALLVIEEGKTQAEQVTHAMNLLQGTNLLGTVLNKSWASNDQENDEKQSSRWSDLLRGYVLGSRALIQRSFGLLRKRKN
jgi:protein-tyrosine kinase